VRRQGLLERFLRWYTGRQIPQGRASGWQPQIEAPPGPPGIEAADLLAVSRSMTAQLKYLLDPPPPAPPVARQIRPAHIAVDGKVFTAVHPGEYGWPDKRLITAEQFEAAMARGAAAQKDGYSAACELLGIAEQGGCWAVCRLPGE
jgi:hypothetical protein